MRAFASSNKKPSQSTLTFKSIILLNAHEGCVKQEARAIAHALICCSPSYLLTARLRNLNDVYLHFSNKLSTIR